MTDPMTTTRDRDVLTAMPGGLHYYDRNQIDELQRNIAYSELTAGELESIAVSLCQDYRLLQHDIDALQLRLDAAEQRAERMENDNQWLRQQLRTAFNDARDTEQEAQS